MEEIGEVSREVNEEITASCFIPDPLAEIARRERLKKELIQSAAVIQAWLEIL